MKGTKDRSSDQENGCDSKASGSLMNEGTASESPAILSCTERCAPEKNIRNPQGVQTAEAVAGKKDDARGEVGA